MSSMRDWIGAGGSGAAVTVLGAPISRASISPSQAWSTPPAFREALARFPTWDAESGDIARIEGRDAGDVEGDRDDTDASAAHARIEAAVAATLAADTVVVVIGGDNSLTRPALHGAMTARPGAAWGLLTLDAHHDCRRATDGPRNGTPVRDLIEAGLPGDRVAQVGIHPLGNAREHAEWALQHGIHVHPLAEVHERGIVPVVASAVDEIVHAGAGAIWVDFDVDVVDRASAPACPASLPGGLHAHDLVNAARSLGADPRVAGADLTEVDAAADVNGITVRLMAATFTAFCAGVAGRSPGPAR